MFPVSSCPSFLFGEPSSLHEQAKKKADKMHYACKKQKLFKLHCQTCGRELIGNLFPQLKVVLEETFNYESEEMVEGLESHPHLMTDIMYTSRDNLFMRQACYILLKVCPPGLGVSLSSCYNYTKSYKEKKTCAAKRCHVGKNILTHKFPCSVIQKQIPSNTLLIFTGPQKKW